MGFSPLLSVAAGVWNLLNHPLHSMVEGFTVAFAALALLMLLFLPRAAGVIRWAGRWTLAAALAAFATGINAAGGLGEVLEEMVEDPTLGRHAWVAAATLAVMVVAVLLGGRRHSHELSRGEGFMLALSFLLVAAAAWLGGEHSLYEDAERDEEVLVAANAPQPPEAAAAMGAWERRG